jgi:GcrA cell cycle regulator
MTGKPWSREQDEELLELEAEGYSASLIGERIGRSREAVIGRSTRLRGAKRLIKAEPRRTTTIIRKDGQIPKPRPAPVPPACTGCGSTQTIEEIRAQHPNALSCCPERNMQRGISIFDLTETSCRWPTVGVVAPYLFCGAPRADVGSSYCPEHARIGFSHRGETR